MTGLSRALTLAAVAAAFAAASIAQSAVAASRPSSAKAVEMLNEWRAKVGVPPVAEDPIQSSGCQKNANYVRLNGPSGHFQFPGNPGYTEEGNAAAQSSVLAYEYDSMGPYTWEEAVYHRAGLLHPRLVTTGFWSEFSSQCMGTHGINWNVVAPAVTVNHYPFSNQTGVGTLFACNETPNPCEEVAGNDGSKPIGFILSATITGPWTFSTGPTNVSASLTPDRGSPADIKVVEDGATGLLAGGFAILPVKKLKPGTWYTATASGQIEGDSTTHAFSVSWRFKTRSKPGQFTEGLVHFDSLGYLPRPRFNTWKYRQTVRNGNSFVVLRTSWYDSPGAVKYRVAVRAGGRTIRRTVRGTSAKFRIKSAQPKSLTLRAVSRSGRVSAATKYSPPK